jgi:hypothetical protein
MMLIVIRYYSGYDYSKIKDILRNHLSNNLLICERLDNGTGKMEICFKPPKTWKNHIYTNMLLMKELFEKYKIFFIRIEKVYS